MTHVDVIALLITGALVCTMPLFAITHRARPLDPDVARRPATILLGRWVRDWLMWLIAPIERPLVRAGVTPDVFNALGVAFGAAAGIAYALGSLSLAGWLVLLGGASDVFDGRIARARGLASRYGAFLDSSLDRFAETFTFAGVILYFVDTPWAVLVSTLALGGSMLVSYTRARGEALGVECKGGLMQRAERLVLLALASILDAPVTTSRGWHAGTLLALAVAVIALGALGTAVYRTLLIARALRREAGASTTM